MGKRNKKNIQTDRHTSRSTKYAKKRKNSNIKLALKITLVVVLLGFVGAIAYGINLYYKAEDLMAQSYKPRSSGVDMNAKIVAKKDPFSVLVMGVDDNEERQLGTARTDTIILVTVNPKEGKIDTVSIPRDTFTYIESPEFTGYSKINAAYTYEQEDGTIEAVEKLMNIPVDFYVTLDFQAFEKIVDSLGGVTIDVPVAISEANADVTKMIELLPGVQTLNGEQALAFARTRKIDNDIKRGERQQMVVKAVIEKALRLESLNNYTSVMDSLTDHFWTDIKSNTLLELAESALSSSYSFETYTFDWMSFNYTYTGESMVGLYQDSIDYISHKMRVSLGLDNSDERDQSGYKFETNGIVSESTYPPYGDGAVDDGGYSAIAENGWIDDGTGY